MKFLVFALCVCAVSAATFDSKLFNKPYKPYQPTQQAKPFGQSAPVAAAKATYNIPQAVFTAPVAAAYEATRAAATVPIVAAKSVYKGGNEAEAAVLRSDSEVTNEGYNYVYETANGISYQASGVLKNVEGNDVIVSQGSYRYQSPDGTPVEFSYVADENGYQPQSNILPVGPPVPEAILRSLEYIRAHTQNEKY